MIGVDGRVLRRYLGRRWCGQGHFKAEQWDCCWELSLFVGGILGILPMEFDLECDALGEEFGAEVAGSPTFSFFFIRVAPFVGSR